MEYLNKSLHKMQKNSNFNHYAKCESLKITNLAFADDFLLFARGDYISVEMMQDTLNRFLASTELIVNSTKSRIYFGGVADSTKMGILNLTSYMEGALPFRYLGVPTTSKKLSVTHYLPLVDKIVGRITHWSAKLLSYAGRVQLIKSVLFAISNYWL
ncbi:unnamed protein product [Lathyrus sativus]|nr:unnamed protein product [Lathyrus sativus]